MLDEVILPTADVCKLTADHSRKERLNAQLVNIKQIIFQAISTASNAGAYEITVRCEPIAISEASIISDWVAGHGYSVSHISTIRALDMVQGFDIKWGTK